MDQLLQLHSNPIYANVSQLKPTFPLPVVCFEFLGCVNIQGEVVTLSPLHQDIKLFPTIIINDQAHQCCLICSVDQLSGALCNYTVVGVQGEEEGD